jgi:hypothetical protein
LKIIGKKFKFRLRDQKTGSSSEKKRGEEKMRLMIAVFIIAAILAGGCASWKKDSMKEPDAYYNSTGETHYKREPMTIFSTEEDEDDDLLPRFEDMD